MRLLPKDETFWQFFSRQTSALCAASDILAGATEEGSSSLPGAAVRIKTIERESMQNLQELQLRLHKTFVTPIDPEDISLLSEHLDHLIAAVESISCRLAAYRFDPLPPLMIDLAKGIHTCAESIERAFGMLSVNEPIDDLCRKLLSMEEQTDFAVREGITRLFEQQKDPIALMKEKDIYDIFERLSDSMKDLANALQNVSIKNS